MYEIQKNSMASYYAKTKLINGRLADDACNEKFFQLDVKLPLSKSMNAELFTAFIRACSHYNCPTIQPNVVSQEELLDAKIHPENHKNLIVRICGLSAYFVALTNEVQDEIIARNMYSM